MEPWKPEDILATVRPHIEQHGRVDKVAAELGLPVELVIPLMMDPWDPIHFLEALRDQCTGKRGAISEKKVADAFGVSQGHIASLRCIAKDGCDSLLEGVRTGSINIDNAKMIARISDKRKQAGLVRRRMNASGRQMTGRVRTEISKHSRKRAPNPASVHDLDEQRRNLISHLSVLFPNEKALPKTPTKIPEALLNTIVADARVEVAHWLGLWKGLMYALGEIESTGLLEHGNPGALWEGTGPTVRTITKRTP